MDSEDYASQLSDDDMVSWLRWWHWLLLVILLFVGLIFFPLWRFEQRWRKLQVGDSFERMTELLGEPGDAAYSVQAVGTNGSTTAYGYSVYWRHYEVMISTATNQVVAKQELRGGPPGPQPLPRQLRKR